MIEIGLYTLSYPEICVLGVVLLSWLIQLFYYLFFYSKVLAIKRPETPNRLPPVSVIICARNEAPNLKKFLPEVLNQDYPDFQVVVVDDCSDDDTCEYLALTKQKHPKLYFTQISADWASSHTKKLALAIGIKAAKHEIVVHIDADCKPASPQWIKQIVAGFRADSSFVLGYGAYEQKKGLLNLLIRFDTAFIGMQYLGFAQAGAPYMGVGRNLAYRKSLFFENKGFGEHNAMASGDDDLLVNKFATKNNTVAVVSPESTTISVPETSWRDWKLQKTRHTTTWKHYKWWHKALISIEPLSRVIFYSSFIAALVFFHNFALHLLAVFLVRSTIQVIVSYKAFKLFNEKKLSWFFIFLDIITPLIYIWFSRKKKKKTYKRDTWM